MLKNLLHSVLEPITIGVQRVEMVVTAQAATKPLSATVFSWGQLLWIAYLLGALIAASRLGYGMLQLSRLYRTARREKRSGYTLVHTPFSFFRWLFWSEVLPYPSKDRDQILRHSRLLRPPNSWKETLRSCQCLKAAKTSLPRRHGKPAATSN